MLIFHIHDLYETYCRTSFHPSPILQRFSTSKRLVNESMTETLIKMCLKWDFPDTNRKRKHKE